MENLTGSSFEESEERVLKSDLARPHVLARIDRSAKKWDLIKWQRYDDIIHFSYLLQVFDTL